MPRLSGPVFSSALSRKSIFSLNSMSRIPEGCTWRFHCNLYILSNVISPGF